MGVASLRRANPVELATIAYHDDTATKLEKEKAKYLLNMHYRKSLSGKVDKHAGARR